jgi:SAM-dependent methyltransferase
MPNTATKSTSIPTSIATSIDAKQYSIHLVNTTEYPAFNDIISSFENILEKKQHPVSTGHLQVRADAINIIFGAHNLHPEQVKSLKAKHIIIYNLEQVHPFNAWFKQNYIQLLKNHQVWDYHPHNIHELKSTAVENVKYVPVSYDTTLAKITQKPEAQKDIDVLFYGLISPRRQILLDTLKQAGLNVVHTPYQSTWSEEERNDYISRAKIVLNMAYADYSQIFEMARVSLLMANHAFVLTENLERVKVTHNQQPPELKECLGFFDYNIEQQSTDIVEKCQHYINQPELRQTMVQKAYEYLHRISFEDYLSKAVDEYIQEKILMPENTSPPSTQLVFPRLIQIGSGKSWRYDCLNLDIEPRYKPDILVDLNQPFPFDQPIQTWRFGEISIPKNYFHYILSEHVFEHIHDLVQAMTNCLDLLTDGGILEIEVPYDLSHGAWQDPTHVRALNENSWAYYTQWYWYIGWTDYRFDMFDLKYNLSQYGQELLNQNPNGGIDGIKHIPRTIDSLRTKLRKRETTDAEKQENKKYYPGYSLQQEHYQSLELV